MPLKGILCTTINIGISATTVMIIIIDLYKLNINAIIETIYSP